MPLSATLRGVGVIIGEKNIIVLFHVSEHLDHFNMYFF